MSVTPEAFEKARADMEEICANAARVMSRDNDDWNSRDHAMIADIQHVIEDTMSTCLRMRDTLHEALDGVLPIEKSQPF